MNSIITNIFCDQYPRSSTPNGNDGQSFRDVTKKLVDGRH